MSDASGRDGSERGWSQLHHGIAPDRVPLLRGWLRGIWMLARPLRRVPPTAITVAGAALAVVALLLASSAPWVALVALLLAVLCDALDGAVALLFDRATRLGAVADKIADRIADTAFALILWRCGAPLLLAVAAGASWFAVEAVRELLRGTRRARITVAERPTRVICAALALACAGLSDATWPATVCAVIGLALGLAGLARIMPSR